MEVQNQTPAEDTEVAVVEILNNEGSLEKRPVEEVMNSVRAAEQAQDDTAFYGNISVEQATNMVKQSAATICVGEAECIASDIMVPAYEVQEMGEYKPRPHAVRFSEFDFSGTSGRALICLPNGNFETLVTINQDSLLASDSRGTCAANKEILDPDFFIVREEFVDLETIESFANMQATTERFNAQSALSAYLNNDPALIAAERRPGCKSLKDCNLGPENEGYYMMSKEDGTDECVVEIYHYDDGAGYEGMVTGFNARDGGGKAIPLTDLMQNTLITPLTFIESKALYDIVNLVDIQGQNGNWDVNEYMTGMFNGMELMVATLQGREPQYRETPALRKLSIESKFVAGAHYYMKSKAFDTVDISECINNGEGRPLSLKGSHWIGEELFNAYDVYGPVTIPKLEQ